MCSDRDDDRLDLSLFVVDAPEIVVFIVHPGNVLAPEKERDLLFLDIEIIDDDFIDFPYSEFIHRTHSLQVFLVIR